MEEFFRFHWLECFRVIYNLTDKDRSVHLRGKPSLENRIDCTLLRTGQCTFPGLVDLETCLGELPTTETFARQGSAHLERDHSCRSALVGSTELARKAGIKPANPAAAVRTIAEPTNVNGSLALNP